MFDLEEAITKWRKAMMASSVSSIEELDELESHLRDEIEEQTRSGISQERAFAIAIERIGEPGALKKEFRKLTPPGREGLRRLKAFLLGWREDPFPSLETLGEAARHAIEVAPEESRRFRHDFVGTEHVLLSLTQSPSQLVANVMRRLGLESDKVHAEIEKLVWYGPEQHAAVGSLPFTPRAKRALNLAVEEAREFGEIRVKPEHIFLGLIREGGGVAALVLNNLGIGIEKVREEILKEMRANQSAEME